MHEFVESIHDFTGSMHNFCSQGALHKVGVHLTQGGRCTKNAHACTFFVHGTPYPRRGYTLHQGVSSLKLPMHAQFLLIRDLIEGGGTPYPRGQVHKKCSSIHNVRATVSIFCYPSCIECSKMLALI